MYFNINFTKFNSTNKRGDIQCKFLANVFSTKQFIQKKKNSPVLDVGEENGA